MMRGSESVGIVRSLTSRDDFQEPEGFAELFACFLELI